MFWLLGLARAACTFSATSEQLATNLSSAEAAYVSLDVPEFQRAMTEVDYLVPCLVEPVSIELAAQLHRIRGLGHYVDGKPEAVESSLRAARLLEPDYRFSTDVLPEGFDLRIQYEAFPVEGELGTNMPRPRSGSLVVDGRDTRLRPPTATLLQVLSEGRVQQSVYLLPTDPLPEYPGVDRRRTTLLTTGAGTGIAAALLYGASWASRAQLQQAVDTQALQAGTLRTHALLGASSTLFVASGVQVAFALGGKR
jgi:hypothetical protein